MESLKFLRISSTCRPGLFEYLSYKYPNIETIEFKGEFCSIYELNESVKVFVDHFCNAIKKIKSKKLSLICRGEFLEDVVPVLKKIYKFIEIDVQTFEDDSRLVLKINTC